jgi:phage gp45-like
MSGPSIAELNAINDPQMRSLFGMIRRMAVSVTSKPLWQAVGYRIAANVETLVAEVFAGIGFYSRPPRNGKPEAIAVFVGGNTKSPAFVAMRDEKTRAAVADIAEDETAIFNSRAVVVVKADGTVEIRLASGVAVALATLADVQALWNFITTMVLPVQTAGTATSQAGYAGPPPSAPVPEVPGGPLPIPAMPAPPGPPSGTSVLRGQ